MNRLKIPIGFITIFNGLVYLLLKWLFYIREGLVLDPMFFIDAVVTSFTFVAGILMYRRVNLGTNFVLKGDKKVLLYLIVGMFFVVISFIYNFSKKNVSGYDALALYDARAKFMLVDGIKFRDMAKLEQYDIFHRDAYFGYPPMTSLMHYYWYVLFGNMLPVGIIYSFFLLSLFFVLIDWFIEICKGNIFLAIFTATLLVSNKNIFGLSLIEYTNLPFMFYIILGLRLISSFIQNKTKSNNGTLLLGFLFVSASIWTRFNEPVWLVISGIFLVIVLLKRINVKFRFLLISLCICLLTYISWKIFVKRFSFTGVNLLVFNNNQLELLVESFMNGHFFDFSLVALKAYNFYLAIFLVAIFTNTKNNITANFFLKLIIFSSLIMYIGGLYFYSLQVPWWRDLVSDSMIRSSIYLLPISLVIILTKIVEILPFKS